MHDGVGGSGQVIGVVKDFHLKSLHNDIEPLMLHLAVDPGQFFYMTIRIAPGATPRTLEFLEEQWRALQEELKERDSWEEEGAFPL